jgi:hypothetical protein
MTELEAKPPDQALQSPEPHTITGRCRSFPRRRSEAAPRRRGRMLHVQERKQPLSLGRDGYILFHHGLPTLGSLSRDVTEKCDVRAARIQGRRC